MTEKLTGKLFLIVGPSGSGKGTVIKMLQSKFKGFVYPISYTTREPREREKDGESYHFITKEKFKQMIAEDDFWNTRWCIPTIIMVRLKRKF